MVLTGLESYDVDLGDGTLLALVSNLEKQNYKGKIIASFYDLIYDPKWRDHYPVSLQRFKRLWKDYLMCCQVTGVYKVDEGIVVVFEDLG